MSWIFLIMIVPIAIIFVWLLFSFLSGVRADAKEMMKRVELANQSNGHH